MSPYLRPYHGAYPSHYDLLALHLATLSVVCLVCALVVACLTRWLYAQGVVTPGLRALMVVALVGVSVGDIGLVAAVGVGLS